MEARGQLCVFERASWTGTRRIQVVLGETVGLTFGAHLAPQALPELQDSLLSENTMKVSPRKIRIRIFFRFVFLADTFCETPTPNDQAWSEH